MDAVEILSALVTRYPGLLPWSDHALTPASKDRVIRELTILVGSWNQVDNYMPPKCGHYACRDHWVSTGDQKCVAPGCDHWPATGCDQCGGSWGDPDGRIEEREGT